MNSLNTALITLVACCALSCNAAESPSPQTTFGESLWPLNESEGEAEAQDSGETNPWLTGFGGAVNPVEPSGDVPHEPEPSEAAEPDPETDPPVPDGSTSQSATPLLLITRYFEGKGADKRLHIKNLGPARQGACVLEIYSNGGVQPWRSLELPFDWGVEEELVLCTTKAEYTQCGGVISGSGFNGNDALVLKCDETVIDSFGRRGEDPGSAWLAQTIPPWGTRDTELIRCDTRADPLPDDAFAPESSWIPLLEGLEIEEALRLCPRSLEPVGSENGGAGGGPATSPG